MKHREQPCEQRDREWASEGHKLENSGQHSHHQRSRQAQKRESNRTNDSDKQTRRELRANVSSERAVDVLEKLVATPAPASTRQHQQRRPPETLRVFQKKEGEDRNQNEPGDVNEISQR